MEWVLQQLGHINFANQYWLGYQFIYVVWGGTGVRNGSKRGYFGLRKEKVGAGHIIMFVLRLAYFKNVTYLLFILQPVAVP
jgi:hypothetical protein